MKISAITVAIAAGLAAAQNNAGDIIWVDGNSNDIEFFAPGTSSTGIFFDGPALAGNDDYLSMAFGPAGDLFVTNGARPLPNLNQIIRISDPFGAQTTSVFSSDPGGVLTGLLDIDYDAGRDQFFTVVNPTNNPTSNNPEPEGLASVNGTTGAANLFFTEDPTRPQTRPFYFGAAEAILDSNTNQYLVTTDGFGVGADASPDNPGNGNDASVLFRIDPATGNEVVVVDFTDVLAGNSNSNTASDTLARVRGLTQLPNGDLVISNIEDDQTRPALGGLYIVDLDSNGDFVGIEPIIEGLAAPGELEYDPFTNSIVFAERDFEQAGTIVGSLSRVNLDGTGYTNLVVGARPSEILIVPTPAGAAVLGLAGLAAARRRR